MISTKNTGNTIVKIILLLCFIIGIIWLFHPNNDTGNVFQTRVMDVKVPPNWLELLSFLHMDSYSICERIFDVKAGSAYKDTLTNYYDILKLEHQKIVATFKKLNTTKNCLEGSSMKYMEETYIMLQLASLPFVQTVCETGFNVGYSTHLWLMAKASIHVYSFDIGKHGCSNHLASYLVKKYPGRLNITWGDSTKTLPKFIENNPNIKCDLMIIDGGHSYPVAEKDRQNFYKMVSGPYNIVFMDNYPDIRFQQYRLGHVWEEGIRNGQVKELFRCNYRMSKQGFCFGTFSVKDTI